jgi:hypothetical protein
MKVYFADEEKKKLIIAEYGKDRYDDMIASLNEPHKIMLTHKTIIPNFIHQALQSLQEA